MLVGRDALDAQPLHVAQRLGKPDGVGDVAGAGLELGRRPLIQRTFRRDVGDHVAAALPRRRLGQRFLGAVEHADSGGAVDLVSGEHEEVGAEFRDVDRHVLNRLSAVDQHPGAVAVTQFDDLVDRDHRAQRVGHLGDGHQLGPRPEQVLELAAAAGCPRRRSAPHFRIAPVFCEISCQGTILAWCSRWVMTISSPGCRCLPPHACATRLIASVVPRTNTMLFGRWRADESAHGVAGLLVGVGGPGRQFVCGAVDVGVLVGVEVRQPVDHDLRLLGGRRVVEPDQRLAVDGLLQDREIGPHRVDVEHLVLVGQLRHRVGRGAGSSSCPRRRPAHPARHRHCVRPAQLGNRRRLGQPERRRATRRHRNGRHRLRPARRAPSGRCPRWAPRRR